MIHSRKAKKWKKEEKKMERDNTGGDLGGRFMKENKEGERRKNSREEVLQGESYVGERRNKEER